MRNSVTFLDKRFDLLQLPTILGALVYLAGRNREAGAVVVKEVTQATGNRDVHFLHLDLTDFSSIVTFVQEFLRCRSSVFFCVRMCFTVFVCMVLQTF